jgi:hypothetical protein
MTKKSVSRLARDKAKKELKGNTCWDDLNEVYNQCARLLHSHTRISEYVKDQDLLRYLGDMPLTVANIRSVTKDLQQLSSELADIKKQHADKTGGSEDPDEVMSTFSIYEMYNLFMERHNAVVMPTVYQILEEFGQAEKRRNEANAATAAQKAQDPNDTSVIDVVVKEPAAALEVTDGVATGEIKLH